MSGIIVATPHFLFLLLEENQNEIRYVHVVARSMPPSSPVSKLQLPPLNQLLQSPTPTMVSFLISIATRVLVDDGDCD